MKNSAIQWTDNTFNPWEGCTKVAPECKNCYAETLVDHRFGRAKWGKGQPRRRTSENLWKQPLRWNASVICPKCGELDVDFRTRCLTCGVEMRKQRVFCLSHGDWLDEEVPIEWLADLLALIRATPNLDWQLLTKRPQNWLERLRLAADSIAASKSGRKEDWKWIRDWACDAFAPDNIWIGVSAGADQKAALDIPAKVHFLSCEPMLHGLDLNYPEPFKTAQRFDWIIFGGESGKRARACCIDWIRQGLAFCRANRIAAFVKQVGAKPYDTQLGGGTAPLLLTFRDSHGGDMSEWPEDLRVREFPQMEKAVAA